MRASERVGRRRRRRSTRRLTTCCGAVLRLSRIARGARPLLQQWARRNASRNASGATFITAFAPAH